MRQIACCIIDCCLCSTNTFECVLLGRHCVRPSLLSTEQEKVRAPMELIVCWSRRTINLSVPVCIYKLITCNDRDKVRREAYFGLLEKGLSRSP